MTEAERREWRACGRGDVSARNRLAERHLPLVHHFARRLESQTGSALELDDLVSAGTLGLLDAVSSYDPERGYRFSTFAARRVQGSMLDELRRQDVAPRSVRRKERRLAEAGERLAVSLNRLPRHQDVADVLGVDPKTLWRWKWDVDRSRRVALTEVAGAQSRSGPEVEERLSRQAELERLHRELAKLPDRERRIVRLYDLEGRPLREIARRLGVSESRVSQLRKRALGRLRARMTDLKAA